MRLCYFVIDAAGQARRVSQASVQGLWEGRLRAADLGCAAGNELRLVSVACDKDLLPRRVYLLRLPLTAGAFTQESYLTLRAFSLPDCVSRAELVRHHAGGWPGSLLRQLAVALDVPVAGLARRLRVGGPLLLAAAMRVSPWPHRTGPA